jgi:uncharacterized membrane protein YdfJ with MMPL/SSD domain
MPPIFTRVHDFLTTYPKSVMLFWLLLVINGAIFGMDFVRNSEDMARAPNGSRAAKDKEAFAKNFPALAYQDPIVLYVACNPKTSKPGCTVVCPGDSACSRNCKGERTDLNEWFAKFSHDLFAWSGSRNNIIQSYEGWYNFTHTTYDKAKCMFASQDGDATFAIFNYDERLEKTEKHAIIGKIKELSKSIPLPDDVEVLLTGPDVVAKEGSDESERQLMTVDIVTMPIALALFATMVRSWRLLLLCILGTFVTTISSFGLLALVCKMTGEKPLSVLTTLTEALSLSMSIDYNLFLHRRLRDEMKNKRSVADSTKIMVEQAGEVVALSCITFCMVFMGFIPLPSADLSSLGKVCVITLIVAFSANVSLTTVFISTFPNFFSKFSFNNDNSTNNVSSPMMMMENGSSSSYGNGNGNNGGNGNDLTRPILNSTSTSSLNGGGGGGLLHNGLPRHRRGPPYRGWYFNFVKKTTIWPYNIIFIFCCYALVVPLAIHALTMERNQDALAIAPRGGEGREAFIELKKYFSGGLLAPFSVVVVHDNTVKPQEFFSIVDDLSGKIATKTGVPRSQFRSPVDLQGVIIPYAVSHELINSNSALCKVEKDLCALYQMLYGQSVSSSGDTMVVTISPSFNPFSTDGIHFVNNVLKVLDESNYNGIKLHLCGQEVEMLEDMNYTLDSFPILLSVTTVIVFLFLSVGFRSAFAPIRLSLTVFLPLAGVLGLSVLIYQDNILGWTKITALSKSDGGFFFFIPIIVVFQALGLILDYDVFTTHRVLEHRQNGFDTQASIVKGIWETQSTVKIAGLIMASVFGGLLLSKEIAVDQFGELLCTAVLVDTLLVQSFLMPAVLSLEFCGRAWWPRKLPTENLITLEDGEFNE